MKFKEWYAKAERTYDYFATPYIFIKNMDHYKLVIDNLERLGFIDGNDFSNYGVPVTLVDIWFCDFWNSHIMKVENYKPYPEDFEVTLEELVELDRREDF